ncbi:MAG: hypothetical protein K2G86_00535 [Prevotella sp.]|nr:hypothetical protein [Prevotella sp.]
MASEEESAIVSGCGKDTDTADALPAMSVCAEDTDVCAEETDVKTDKNNTQDIFLLIVSSTDCCSLFHQH